MKVKIVGAVVVAAAIVGSALPMHGGNAEAAGQFTPSEGSWYTTVNGQNFNVFTLWRR